MYSNTAVGMCFKSDRRSCESENLRCSAFKLWRRGNKVTPVGFEPTPPAPKACTPSRQSVMYGRRRSVRSRLTPYGNCSRNPRYGRLLITSDGSHVVQSGSRLVFNCCFEKSPTKCCREICFRIRSSVISHEWLTVDRPAHLVETPAPFTSRSPDIATLGPSCTPNWQLDNNQ